MSSKRILDSIKLPTLSKTLLEIIEVEKANPITFLEDIKKTVEKDPLFSAHLLKVANSPFYGFSQKIRTLSHAISLLGIRKVKAMAFSFSFFDFFKKADYKTSYGGTFNLILKKSLLVSAISSLLAKKISYLDSEELYISGLLAEIGELILFLYSPDKYCHIYSIHDKKLIPEEKDMFQTDHVELGIEFCDRYSLPNFFKTAVENHAELCSDEEHSRISFISAQIAELLLTENEEDRTPIFKEIENHTKKLLHLSLSEVEQVIKGLPVIMEAFMVGFPEVQKDLKKVVEAGSTIIIDLMKKEMEMVMLTQKLTDSQKKLANEKMFLSHMLNLSYFFSSLMPPVKIISSLFEYFENFINEFTIEFIYKLPVPEGESYLRIKNKEEIKGGGSSIEINRFSSLVKSKIANEVVRLGDEEMLRLGKAPGIISLVFPVSYHYNFFGFLILDVESKDYFALDLEMSYVQILSNIIANSFQNFLSFEGLENETNKKKLVTKELFKFDKELNHSRETLIEMQKSEIMGEMLPIIFHKLKNKLTPILGYSQILLTKVQDSAISERLKKIEKSANDLANQLNVLRNYFKPEKTTKERENLNAIITRLKPYFSEIETKENIKIVLDADDSIADDLLNPGQIEVLITKIVDNSVLAIKEKSIADGRIDIKTEPVKDGCKLIIKDNGIGIKEENIPRIWTPFYSDFPHQAGIGLTICEKIISNHDASYQVRSKEGEFTEIEITFKKQLEEEGEIGEGMFKPQKRDIHGKILIVDDEGYLLDLMKEILLNEGDFEIITTTSGEEAIELIDRDNGFDLVISDIRMPDVDGMQVYDFLKSKQMESRVMMVTADPFSEDVALFLKKNRIRYLRKPFELMKFKQLVLEQLS
ncbi:MAG: HDOD domain-containing protein [Candidatus Aminicenantes bacterium]|nr:MAG: HDOD domain-containing protein [Candidatus Aminicenantes bacterium]